MGNHRTLVLYPHGQPVDMLVAGTADHEDTFRRIPPHLPVHAPGDPVDLKQREGKVFSAEFAGPLNGES